MPRIRPSVAAARDVVHRVHDPGAARAAGSGSTSRSGSASSTHHRPPEVEVAVVRRAGASRQSGSGRPSSSISQTRSAPRSTAQRRPSWNPPAPPVLSVSVPRVQAVVAGLGRPQPLPRAVGGGVVDDEDLVEPVGLGQRSRRGAASSASRLNVTTTAAMRRSAEVTPGTLVRPGGGSEPRIRGMALLVNRGPRPHVTPEGGMRSSAGRSGAACRTGGTDDCANVDSGRRDSTALCEAGQRQAVVAGARLGGCHRRPGGLDDAGHGIAGPSRREGLPTGQPGVRPARRGSADRPGSGQRVGPVGLAGHRRGAGVAAVGVGQRDGQDHAVRRHLGDVGEQGS